MQSTVDGLNLTPADLRWLVDAYEQSQKTRIQIGERIRAVLQGRDNHPAGGAPVKSAAIVLREIRKGIHDGPLPLLGRNYRLNADAEESLRKGMIAALELHPAWSWLRELRGIGPTLAARLLGRLRIERAPSPSSFWAYCGLSTIPAARYRCETCQLEVTRAIELPPPAKHTRRATKVPCPGRLHRMAGDPTLRVAIRNPARGPRRYDHDAKTICYLIGVSFLRAGGVYARYYARQRAALEQRDEVWPPGRLHASALRKTEKLFLAHLWTVWREAVGLPVAIPYAQSKLGMAGYVPPFRESDDLDLAS